MIPELILAVVGTVLVAQAEGGQHGCPAFFTAVPASSLANTGDLLCAEGEPLAHRPCRDPGREAAGKLCRLWMSVLRRQRLAVVEQGGIRRDSRVERKAWVMLWECICPLLVWIVPFCCVYLD